MQRLGSSDALFLAGRAAAIGQAAREFIAFADQDPGLAAHAGVEISALEARVLLSGGAVDRVASLASQAARLGRAFDVSGQDIEAVSRLEGVLALASSRIDFSLAGMAAAEAGAGPSMLGTYIGLATGAVGLFKTIF